MSNSDDLPINQAKRGRPPKSAPPLAPSHPDYQGDPGQRVNMPTPHMPEDTPPGAEDTPPPTFHDDTGATEDSADTPTTGQTVPPTPVMTRPPVPTPRPPADNASRPIPPDRSAPPRVPQSFQKPPGSANLGPSPSRGPSSPEKTAAGKPPSSAAVSLAPAPDRAASKPGQFLMHIRLTANMIRTIPGLIEQAAVVGESVTLVADALLALQVTLERLERAERMIELLHACKPSVITTPESQVLKNEMDKMVAFKI